MFFSASCRYMLSISSTTTRDSVSEGEVAADSAVLSDSRQRNRKHLFPCILLVHALDIQHTTTRDLVSEGEVAADSAVLSDSCQRNRKHLFPCILVGHALDIQNTINRNSVSEREAADNFSILCPVADILLGKVRLAYSGKVPGRGTGACRFPSTRWSLPVRFSLSKATLLDSRDSQLFLFFFFFVSSRVSIGSASGFCVVMMRCPGPIDSADFFFGGFADCGSVPVCVHCFYFPCPCAGGFSLYAVVLSCRYVAILLQPRCKSGEGDFMCVVFPICICGADGASCMQSLRCSCPDGGHLPSLPVEGE